MACCPLTTKLIYEIIADPWNNQPSVKFVEKGQAFWLYSLSVPASMAYIY